MTRIFSLENVHIHLKYFYVFQDQPIILRAQRIRILRLGPTEDPHSFCYIAKKILKSIL